MPTDMSFWYELALKMAMTATIVVFATLAVERSGAFIGALIAALPTAASAAYIILGLEHTPAFISASAIGSLAGGAAVLIFSLCYAVLAQRHGLVLSLTVATAVWFMAAAASRLVDWTPVTAVIVNAVVFAITIPASARYRHVAVLRQAGKRTPYDIPLRALTAALAVAVVTTASHRIGSFFSGVFAVFPIVMGCSLIVLLPRLGGPAAAAMFAHAQVPLIGLALGFLSIHYLAEPIGVWWAYAVGLSICIGWNALLWLAQPARTPTAPVNRSSDSGRG